MYYSNLIKIKFWDIVLEIGPGSSPFWRSDFLLDKYDNNDIVPAGNFGGGKLKISGKPFLKISDNRIPFKNNSFDAVILSHVLEHVPSFEISSLLKEAFRIAPRVYIEFPAPLYEYLFDVPAHLNLMDINGDYIYCLPKEKAVHLNGSLVTYIRELNASHNLNLGRRSKELFTSGKWFEGKPPGLVYFDSEEDFINRLLFKTLYPKTPGFPAKAFNKIQAFIWPFINIFRRNKVSALIFKNMSL
jgi:predicted SAM-dependent methyltransferase